MCYDDEARPPLPPGAAGKAQGEDLVLTADAWRRILDFIAARTGAVS